MLRRIPHPSEFKIQVCDLEAPGSTYDVARRTCARAVSFPPASSSSTAGTLRRTPPSARRARRSPCRRRPSSSSSATKRPTSWTIASSAMFSAAKTNFNISAKRKRKDAHHQRRLRQGSPDERRAVRWKRRRKTRRPRAPRRPEWRRSHRARGRGRVVDSRIFQIRKRVTRG